MQTPLVSEGNETLTDWGAIDQKIGQRQKGKAVTLDGHNLDIGKIVAIARRDVEVHVDNEKLEKLENTVNALHADLDRGKVIYGVNTGFGGSADTRTHAVVELQSTLMRELHSGILPVTDGEIRPRARKESEPVAFAEQERDSIGLSSCPNTCMPESWARASIVVRVNSLASGYSGVRSAILQSMVGLLKEDIVPLIPLRGSVSASGDLMPLSYIGGAIQGDPGIRVWAKNPLDCRRRITTADVALRESSQTPIELKPKEGLAIINGTAISTAVAALVMHDANCLGITSQVLTAMSVEALGGAKESFDPIFAKLRPHPGQIQAARSIYRLLEGSKLATDSGDHGEGSLRQDRYSIRTASQWIGPVLEDFSLASSQVTIECNSVTDNPLIDIEREGRSLHGGNFQAKAITSAMEKTRSGLQSLGQMLFAQCTELINPRLNFGLPPNLTADEPSESFILKPLDIMIAALQSELGFLSNSAGSHVQSAEMGNQALNSLALISARYTHTALEVLMQLASAHVFALCQAFDLRAMYINFLVEFEPRLLKETKGILAAVMRKETDLQQLHQLLWQKFCFLLNQTTSMDTVSRFSHIFRTLQPTILDAAETTSEAVSSLRAWTARCSESATQSFARNRDEYSQCPDASPFLGVGSRRIYRYIRHELSIPFLRTKDFINISRPSQPDNHEEASRHHSDVGKRTSSSPDAKQKRKRCSSEQRHGSSKPQDRAGSASRFESGQNMGQAHSSENRPEKRSRTSDDKKEGKGRRLTVGSHISVIYEAFTSGSFYDPIFACLDDIKAA